MLQLTFTLPVTVPFIVTVSALTNKSSASPLKFTSPLATYIPFAFVPSFISTLAAAAFIFLSTFELINIVAPATLILPPTLSVSIVMLFPAARISASTFPANFRLFPIAYTSDCASNVSLILLFVKNLFDALSKVSA